MPKIDAYGKKILYELDRNSRQSAQQIGRKLRLSKVSIIKRISKLRSGGLIKNFIALINYRKLGFTNYHVYLSLQNLSERKEESLINFLKKLKEVNYIIQLNSEWDLMLAIFAKDNEQLDETLGHISKKFSRFIKEFKVFIIIKTIYSGRNYLENRENPVQPLIRKKVDEIKIDKIDEKILRAISLNARMPVIDLAKMTRVKAEVIGYRLKKLLERGVIQRFTIDLDNEKFGNSFYKLLIKISSSLEEEIFVTELSRFKSSFRIHKIMGEKIIEADFEVENDKALREIIKNLKGRFGDKIEEFKILPIYSVIKLDYCPV